MSTAYTDDVQSAMRKTVLARDQILLDLGALVHDNTTAARGAGKRINDRIQDSFDRKNKAKRKSVEETLGLLPIARDIVLDRSMMESASEMKVDPSAPPPGFDPIGSVEDTPVAVWVERTFRAIGRFDRNVSATVGNLVVHLANATRGSIGDYVIEKQIDLSQTTAVDAYIHALSALWSEGRDTPEQVREQLDPSRVTDLTAIPWYGLSDIVDSMLRSDPERPLRTDEIWEIGILVLLCVDPSFDATSVDIGLVPPWDPSDEASAGRCGLLEYCGLYTENTIPLGFMTVFWLLAERAVGLLESETQSADNNMGEITRPIKNSDLARLAGYEKKTGGDTVAKLMREALKKYCESQSPPKALQASWTNERGQHGLAWTPADFQHAYPHLNHNKLKEYLEGRGFGNQSTAR